jgi:deoxyhypusine synthase
VTATDKIEILRQTVGDGSSGLYLAIRNTNTTSDILLDVYKNEEKVKVLTVKHRGSGLTPIVTYDGVEFPAITTYGE